MSGKTEVKSCGLWLCVCLKRLIGNVCHNDPAVSIFPNKSIGNEEQPDRWHYHIYSISRIEIEVKHKQQKQCVQNNCIDYRLESSDIRPSAVWKWMLQQERGTRLQNETRKHTKIWQCQLNHTIQGRTDDMITCLEAFSVDDGWAGFVVLWLWYPHLHSSKTKREKLY